MEPKELDERRRTAEHDAVSVKRAEPRITLLNEPLRHHEADGALTAESIGELREDREIRMKPDAVEVTDPER